MNRVWRRRRDRSGFKPRAVMESIEPRQLLAASISYIDVPISAAARAADPTLNNLRTVDARLTISGGDDWLAADIKIVLTTGSFYNVKIGGNTPNKAAWPVLPHLEFDTFVSGPDFTAPSILGRKEGVGSAIFSPTEINVAFGDLVNTGDGTFTLARMTMTPDAVGILEGNIFLQSFPGNAAPINTIISPPTSLITGRVYNDLNGDGKRQDNEPSLIRWQVFIDKNNNGQLDPGEYSVRTNNKGFYTFVNPGNETHRVRVRLQDGFRRSAPLSGNGSFNVTISPGVISTQKDFGVTQRGRLGGFVFADANSNGTRNAGESGLSGWRVYIDRNNNGRFDSSEVNMRTGSDGYFEFGSLATGTYRLRIVQVGGWTPTTNTSLVINVVNGTDNRNLVFGQRKV